MVLGVYTHICIRHTAADAFFRGYHIMIPKDGVKVLSADEQEQGLKYLENVYGAKIMTANDVIKEIVDLKGWLVNSTVPIVYG